MERIDWHLELSKQNPACQPFKAVRKYKNGYEGIVDGFWTLEQAKKDSEFVVRVMAEAITGIRIEWCGIALATVEAN